MVGLHPLKAPIQSNLFSDSVKAYMLKIKAINNIKAYKSKISIYQSERHHLSHRVMTSLSLQSDAGNTGIQGMFMVWDCKLAIVLLETVL